MWQLTAAFLVALLPMGAAAASQGAARPSAADLAAQIQAHYNTVRDFRAGFRQTYTSGALGEKDTEAGDLMVKKPNRMFWKYTTPEKKNIIADGAQLIDYEPSPADPRCTINPLPTGDDISVGILFLAGRGDLTRDFTGTVPAGQATDTWQIDLVPKKPQDDFVSLSVIVARGTLALKGFITIDAEHNTSHFEFMNLKENVGLDDQEFAFKPPRGVKCQ
jgi:outer membrane lipoprotein carrier protein